MRCLFGMAASCVLTLSSTTAARAEPNTPQLLGLPAPLAWQNRPATWEAADGKSLTLTAGKKTDWFVWPGGGYRADASARLLFRTANNFMFSTQVNVRAQTTYDAGCIVLYDTNTAWAKFCLEAQNGGGLSVISVVTRDLSDDATSYPVSGTSVYLKMAKADDVVFFYASADGKAWTIIRKFAFASPDGLSAGFSAQSPDGNGATALFSNFQYRPERVDLWKLQ